MLWLLFATIVRCQSMGDLIFTAQNPRGWTTFDTATTNRLMNLNRLSIEVVIEEDVIETDMIASLSKKPDFTRLYRTGICGSNMQVNLKPFSFTQSIDDPESYPRHLVTSNISEVIKIGYSSFSAMASLSRYQPATRMFDITFLYASLFVEVKQQYKDFWYVVCSRHWRRFWRKKCWWVCVVVERDLYPIEIVYIRQYMHALLVREMQNKITSQVVPR